MLRATRTRAARAPSEQQLRHLRVSFIQVATLQPQAGAPSDVRLLDLGLRGVSVEWPGAGLDPGARADVSFRLPGNEIPIRARCRVGWRDARRTPGAGEALPARAGLEFVELGAGDAERLRAFLAEHACRSPRARQFTRVWPETDDEEVG